MLLPLIWIAGILYIAMLLLLAFAWTKIRSPRHAEASTHPLSVIIAARNEASNLAAKLPSILKQDYPDFEVILVLDRCTDGSLQLLQSFQKAHSHLRWVEITETPSGWAGKKWALTQGIKASRHECLVFTDADCRAEENWLSKASEHFSEGKELILGLGPYETYPGLLNRFIRWETFYAAFQYMGLARLGMPYMGVGRNLAYRKDFFEKNEGFEAFRERLSGDDDLLINAYAKGESTACMIAAGSRTFSEPKRSFGSWMRQKVRHISSSVRYSIFSQIILSAFHLSHMAFYGGLLLSLAWGETASLLLGLYLGRILPAWYIFSFIKQKTGEKNLVVWYPVLDFLIFIFNLSIVPLGLIARKPEWNKNQEFQKIPRKTESS